jgi:hypothetical protein
MAFVQQSGLFLNNWSQCYKRLCKLQLQRTALYVVS